MSDPQTILIVDDEEIIGDVLRRRFERLGFEVLLALGGRQAIALLQEHIPDLVVCDAMLHDDVSSNDVLDATRHLHPVAKFAVMSGHLPGDDSISFITERDISLFIKKPFSSLGSVVTRLTRLLKQDTSM